MKSTPLILLGLFLLAGRSTHGQVPQTLGYQGRIAAAGTNFSGDGQFKFALVSGGTGLVAQATATATVSFGFLVHITVTSGGAGYVMAPTVTISDPTGTGASATAQIANGQVTAITVNDAGSGYSSSPIITIEPPPAPGTISHWSNDGSSSGGAEPANPVAIHVSGGLFSLQLGDANLPNMTPIPPSVFARPDLRLRIWFSDGLHGWQRLSPDQPIASVGYAMMSAAVPDGAITSAKLAPGVVGAAQLAPGAVLANLLAGNQSAVPSGGIILSLEANSSSLTGAGYGNVGTVPLVPERWETRATSPGPRQLHTAVWTGTEMLVWGGGDSGVFLNNGGRYNPVSDTWQTISPTNAPGGRWQHCAVWTGTEMLIWGGRNNFATSGGNRGDGGAYNPASNTWRTIKSSNAPSPRSLCACVWSGTEMLIWGGIADGNANLGDGARYNPMTDTWTPIRTNGAPSPRQAMAAVWTGTEMVIWSGGISTNTSYERITCFQDGARYNPATDQWRPLSTNGAPHVTALMAVVWTGKEMVVWGGEDWTTSGLPGLATGGRYNPATDSWRSISSANAPSARDQMSSIWSGTELFIWGGWSGSAQLNTGARYDPEADIWTQLTGQNAPSARSNASAVWTGQALLIFGGWSSSSGLNSNHAWFPGQTIYLYERH